MIEYQPPSWIHPASPRFPRLVATVLFLLTLLAYSGVFHNDFVNFDDPFYVTDNNQVRQGLNARTLAWAMTSFELKNWHPLTWLSHLLDVSLFGMNPAGHHLTSLLLHGLNVLLLFRLFHFVTGRLWPAAFLAAAFALHPLHVESVAWISERKDVLSAAFFLLTLLAWLRYTRSGRALHYVLALLAYAAGLASKSMLVTLPAILILMDWWPLGRLRLPGRPPDPAINGVPPVRLLLEKIPFAVLAGSVCWLTLTTQQGAIVSLASQPLSGRLGNAAISLFRYLEKTIWPVDLSVFYPFEPVAARGLLLPAVLLVVLTALAVAGYRRFPVLTTGWFWFLGMLIPVIGLVQVGSQSMADRYMYLPLIGLLLPAAYLPPALPHRRPAVRTGVAVFAALLLGWWGVQTFRQVRVWQNGVTLFTHALAITPSNELAEGNLGTALKKQGRLDEAAIHYQRALQLNPANDLVLTNLGNLHFTRGNWAAAEDRYREALRYNPVNLNALIMLGLTLQQREEWPAARKILEHALTVDPRSAEIHFYLGRILILQEQRENAIRHLREAVRLDPELSAARQALELLGSSIHQPASRPR